MVRSWAGRSIFQVFCVVCGRFCIRVLLNSPLSPSSMSSFLPFLHFRSSRLQSKTYQCSLSRRSKIRWRLQFIKRHVLSICLITSWANHFFSLSFWLLHSFYLTSIPSSPFSVILGELLTDLVLTRANSVIFNTHVLVVRVLIQNKVLVLVNKLVYTKYLLWFSV